MYSKGHSAVGAAVSLPLVVLLFPDAGLPLAGGLWLYGVALSVGIDADHFLVARLRVGDWRNLRRLLDSPRETMADQSKLFDDDHLTELNRLLSHVLIGGALVAATWAVAESLAEFTAVVLYVHLLADLLWDNGLV